MHALADQRPKVQALTALYILERLLHVTRPSAFTHRLAEALVLPPHGSPVRSRSPAQQTDGVSQELLSTRLENGELAAGLPLSDSEPDSAGDEVIATS